MPSTFIETASLEREFSQFEAMLPVQFHDSRRGFAETEPWRRLMAALLIDAVRCFQTNLQAHHSPRRQMFEEARSWIFSNNDGVFSFMAICHALQIDPSSIRKGLARWSERRLAGEKSRMIRRPPTAHCNSQRRGEQTYPTEISF